MSILAIYMLRIVGHQETDMKNWLKCFGVACLVMGLAACNTIEGVGKDIGKAGDTIEGAAKNNK
jgi:predicted small secreted protein